MKPFRIEFFGYPGCGKTSNMIHVRDEWPDFEMQTANVAFNFHNFWKLVEFIFKKPKVLIVLTSIRFIPLKYYKIYLFTVIRFFSRIMVIENALKSDKKYIVDEGVLQITWSLLLLLTIYSERFNAKKKLEFIVRNLWPNADLLVYHISLDDAEYIRRVKLRERQHYFSKAYLANNHLYIEIGREIKNIILEAAYNKYKIVDY